MKITNFWKLLLNLPLFAKKCWRHQKFLSQNFFGCNFEKLVWLPRFGTSFSVLTSLLKILRGVGHFDPSPWLPFSKKPNVGRVKELPKVGRVKVEIACRRVPTVGCHSDSPSLKIFKTKYSILRLRRAKTNSKYLAIGYVEQRETPQSIMKILYIFKTFDVNH